jgi:hypothetical protein
MTLQWIGDQGHALSLWSDNTLIAEISALASAAITYRDEVEPVDDGVFRWIRRFTALQTSLIEPGHLVMELTAAYAATYSLIPAVSYNGNPWGSGAEPRGFAREGVPWSFAWHRTAVPGATYSEGSAWSVALYGAPPPENVGFSCSLIREAARTMHRLLWPEEERPVAYTFRDGYSNAFVANLHLQQGQELACVAYIVVAPAAPPERARHRFLDVAWTQNYHEPAAWQAPDTLWRLGVRYAKESLWAEEDGFRGFSIGLHWNGECWQQREQGRYEIGWCGQNISLANALLHDYLRSGDLSSLDKGLAALDSWATMGSLQNGLVHCHMDMVLAGTSLEPGEDPAPEMRAELQDACNLGRAAVDFFEAARLAARCGVTRPRYERVARGICDFAVAQQDHDGRFGRAWTNDGTCIDRNGTIGCFLVPPLLVAYERTGDPRYMQAAERGYAFYGEEFLRQGFTTAGALDTDCIDKESALPLFTAALDLYELTHRDIYLRGAEQAGQYLATWQWHHTVPYPRTSALGAMDYDTFGGTAVSTQHHHLDPFAVAFVPGWLRLAEITGNEIWKQRARAAWAQATIGVSDGNLVVAGKLRPPGSQDEGALHTRWGHDGHEGAVSEWLVAWPTAFRLAVLRDLPDWSVLPSPREAGYSRT